MSAVALHPLKSNDGADQIELTLVSAVATVLLIRGYLQLTGYPKVGNGELHIAHLLYGGLFMLLSIFLMLVLLNTGARWYAALLGGIGFGFFIDEIGKFISKDVNYFFKPAVAVMYAVFVVLFLALGALRRWRTASRPQDALANALSLLAGAAGSRWTRRRGPASRPSSTAPIPRTRSWRASARRSRARSGTSATRRPPTSACGTGSSSATGASSSSAARRRSSRGSG